MLTAYRSQTHPRYITAADDGFADTADSGTDGRFIGTAFAIGMTINMASIFIGNPYIVTTIVVVCGLLFTLVWAKCETAWMLLVSLLAANPVNADVTISCNLVFALWLTFLHMEYITRLPRWIVIPNLVAAAAVLVSSINWFFIGSKLLPLNQLSCVVNYVAGPFLLMPVIFFRAGESRFIKSGHLLAFLIIPSVLTVLMVYIFGHRVGTGLETSDLQTNLFGYSFGNTTFRFIRTQIGFLLASLICASAAIILCEVKILTRVLAGVAFAATFFLLMVTASIGSAIACVGGLAVMLAAGLSYFSLSKYLVFLPVVASLVFSIWVTSPKVVQTYVVKHYEERIGNSVNNADRENLWAPSLRYIARNPEGTGWSLFVREIMVYPHNDYFAYAIAYGIAGALVYLSVLGYLLFQLLASVKAAESPSEMAIVLAGVGVAVVIFINSFSDHLSANRWYYNVLWSIVWLSYFHSRPSRQTPDAGVSPQ